MVWTDLVVDVQSSVDQEVEENIPDCGLIRGDVFNQGWIEGAVVPWVILKIGWGWRLSVGEQEVPSNLVYEVHIPRVTISDIGSAGAEGGWGYPAEDSEVYEGLRWRRSWYGGTVHIDDEVIGGEGLLMNAVVDHSVVLKDVRGALSADALEDGG